MPSTHRAQLMAWYMLDSAGMRYPVEEYGFRSINGSTRPAWFLVEELKRLSTSQRRPFSARRRAPSHCVWVMDVASLHRTNRRALSSTNPTLKPRVCTQTLGSLPRTRTPLNVALTAGAKQVPFRSVCTSSRAVSPSCQGSTSPSPTLVD